LRLGGGPPWRILRQRSRLARADLAVGWVFDWRKWLWNFVPGWSANEVSSSGKYNSARFTNGAIVEYCM